jgi:hypothetical protein
MKVKKTEVRRDLHFAGYDFTSGPSGTIIHRECVKNVPGKDYGHNGMREDGMFEMVPSGDIVDREEMHKRLN